MQENFKSSTAKFLAAKTFAVAGASRDWSKYGNKVFQALVASGRTVYPLNPSAPEVEGHPAYATIADLPEVPLPRVAIVQALHKPNRDDAMNRFTDRS